MRIARTTNQDEIRTILFHPSIYPEISGGKQLDFDTTVFPLDSALYIGGYNGDIFALSCFHDFKDGLKFHPNVLPEYRLQYARDFIQQSLDMVKCPVYIEIPINRKRLFNLAKKIGFDSIANNKDPSNTILMRLS